MAPKVSCGTITGKVHQAVNKIGYISEISENKLYKPITPANPKEKNINGMIVGSSSADQRKGASYQHNNKEWQGKKKLTTPVPIDDTTNDERGM